MAARLDPVYQLDGEADSIVVYAGDLTISAGDDAETVPGQLELQLGERHRLLARFGGSEEQRVRTLGLVFGEEVEVGIPAGAPLVVPDKTERERFEADRGLPRSSIPVGLLIAGDPARATSYVVHVSTDLDAAIPTTDVPEGGGQRQIPFALPEWDLVLVQLTRGRQAERAFPFAVGATYIGVGAATSDDLEQLRSRLFILLSFIAGREVGVEPVCGLDQAGDVVWIHWAPPRLRPGRPGARWCTRDLVAAAVPSLAAGYAQLAINPASAIVVDRAINHLLVANGDEVLDVRVPLASAGLELLGWDVLQRHSWMTPDVINNRALTAGARTRLLLMWAGIDAEIPPHLTHLAARARAASPGWGGPETLFEIRNKLVHPPKKLDDPEWPSPDELIEAWQLASWYLELVLLRLLGYTGKYWSRLRLGRYGSDTQPVPWLG